MPEAAITGSETVRRLFDDAYGQAQRPCIEDPAGLVTRGELRSRSTELGEQIAGLVGRGALIAVLCERDRGFVEAVLAAHSAGGAHLPLDASHPDERLATVLAAAGPDLTLTTSALASRLPAGSPALLIDTGEVVGGVGTGTGRCAGLSYLIFTSGTTGRPKGVAITDAGLAAYFRAVDALLGHEPDQVWLAVSSVTFDSSVGEILWPAVSGHLVRLGDNRLPDLMDMAADPTRRLTHLQCAPTLLRLLADEPEAVERLRRTGTLLLGGEPFPLDMVPLLKGEAAGPRLVNVYGPTEATVWVSSSDVGPDAPGPVPIGTANQDTVLRVLDENLHPVADGEPGVLWISGPQLAAGYWRDPVLTAQTFVPDPFGDEGARMYRTGDVAKTTAEGIVILGRDDDQVKIRGNRVELGEIEQVLRGMPGVRDAVCLLLGAAGEEKSLVAVLTGSGVDGRAVRRHVAALLPGYMVPHRVVVRADLPLSAGGKVDRRRLSEDVGVP